jgi:hypothetical protein
MADAEHTMSGLVPGLVQEFITGGSRYFRYFPSYAR